MTKRTITIGLIVMVAINLVLISMIVLHSGGHDRSDRSNRHDSQGGSPSSMLVRQLDLGDTQKAQFEELSKAHFTVVEPKTEKIGQLKKRLMNTTDRGEAQKLTSDIGKLEGEIDYLTFDHFMKVREMCTEEQKQKMDDIKKRISERMSERHHRNHSERSKH